MMDSGEMEYSRILNQAIVIGQIIGGFMLAVAIAQMILLWFFHPFSSLFCIMYQAYNCVLCCFSPDMFNPTTQSSLDVFLLLERVPRERSKEGRCI